MLSEQNYLTDDDVSTAPAGEKAKLLRQIARHIIPSIILVTAILDAKTPAHLVHKTMR